MKVLIIGSGYTVEHDLAKVNRDDFDLVIGVNAAALAFGPVDVHVTLHPEKYAACKAGYLVTARPCRGSDFNLPSRWPGSDDSGSSSLFAVKYALEVREADYVLLAGVPMQGPHFNKAKDWGPGERFFRTWEQQAHKLRGKVFSLSGRTAELLNGLDQPKMAGITGN